MLEVSVLGAAAAVQAQRPVSLFEVLDGHHRLRDKVVLVDVLVHHGEHQQRHLGHLDLPENRWTRIRRADRIRFSRSLPEAFVGKITYVQAGRLIRMAQTPTRDLQLMKIEPKLKQGIPNASSTVPPNPDA